MKTYEVTLYRRRSAFSEWYFYKTYRIEARNRTAAWNKATRQFANPYQYVFSVEEVQK